MDLNRVEHSVHRIVYDADCGFCQASVDGLLKRVPAGSFIAVPSFQAGDLPGFSDQVARREVRVYTSDGRWIGGADAVFFVLKHSRLKPLAYLFGAVPLIWPSRLVYKWIAKNRHRVSKWMNLPTECAINPTDRQVVEPSGSETPHPRS